MLSVTMQVVGIRVARFTIAGTLPDERDIAEFSLMGWEKPEAMCELLQAIASSFVNVGYRIGGANERTGAGHVSGGLRTGGKSIGHTVA